MKKACYFLLFFLFAINGQAAIKVANVAEGAVVVHSPKEYTGQQKKHLKKKAKKGKNKKMGFFKKMKLKLAKKLLMKKNKKSSDLPKAVYVVLSIFWLGWLAMGVLDDWNGDNWWICLLLYFLFWLPGFIFAMVKMSEYY